MSEKEWNEIELRKRRKSCMTLVLIPVIIAIIGVVAFLLATLLEGPTSRGTLYTLLMLLVILMPYLAPIPCICLSVIGIAHSRVLRRYNISTTSINVVGVLGIIIEVFAAVFAVLIFASSMSV